MSFIPRLLRVSSIVLLIVLATPYIYGRLQVLPILFRNSPVRLKEFNSFPVSNVRLLGRIRNCEDISLVQDNGFAILSCDPGRDLWNTVMGTFSRDRSQIPDGELLLYYYSQPEGSEDILQTVKLVGQPADYSFHPLGIEYHSPSSTLFVCNHHLQGSRVDIFSLDLLGQWPVATYLDTVMNPLLRSPNSIAALNEHEIYVSNDHYVLAQDYPLLSRIEAWAAIPGGSLVHISLGSTKARVRRVARIPFANGIALLNSSIIAVASTSKAQILTYNILDDRSVRVASQISVPFAPDNLSVDEEGSLYVAGHPHPPSLDSMRLSRFACVTTTGLNNESCRARVAPSWVAKWSASGGLTNLYVSKGEFGSSSTAVYDASRGLGLVSGLYERGVLVWKKE